MVFHSGSEKLYLSTFLLFAETLYTPRWPPRFRLQSTCNPRSDAAGKLPFSMREKRFAAAREVR